MNIIQPETSLPNNNSSTISAEKPFYCKPIKYIISLRGNRTCNHKIYKIERFIDNC